jgi:hypothetical protein
MIRKELKESHRICISDMRNGNGNDINEKQVRKP